MIMVVAVKLSGVLVRFHGCSSVVGATGDFAVGSSVTVVFCYCIDGGFVFVGELWVHCNDYIDK